VDIIKGNALSERRNFAPNLLGLGRIEPRMKSERLAMKAEEWSEHAQRIARARKLMIYSCL